MNGAGSAPIERDAISTQRNAKETDDHAAFDHGYHGYDALHQARYEAAHQTVRFWLRQAKYLTRDFNIKYFRVSTALGGANFDIRGDTLAHHQGVCELRVLGLCQKMAKSEY
ncbi:hypothetical protein PG984_011398 [Apiospora sp. TS-2023a]